MAIEVECDDEDCDYEEEVGPRDIPLNCPKCHSNVKRSDAPDQPEDAKTDKI